MALAVMDAHSDVSTDVEDAQEVLYVTGFKSSPLDALFLR